MSGSGGGLATVGPDCNIDFVLCTRGGGHGTAASGGVHDPLYHIIHVPFFSNNLKTNDRREIIHRSAKNVRKDLRRNRHSHCILLLQ